MTHAEDTERVEVEFRKDRFLAHFAGLVHRSPVPVALSITLLLPSGVVTGQLIGYREYLRLLEGEMPRLLGPGTGTETLSALFKETRETMTADIREEQTQEVRVDLEEVEYLHLTNAKLVYGNQVVPQPGVLLRIRIRDVSGFCWGQLGPAGSGG